MKSEENAQWGARIERGRVKAVVTDDGSARYDVESYDRPGVTAFGMPGLGDEVHVGDDVYFFIFEDGLGCVLGEITR